MAGWEVEPVPVAVERAVLEASSRDAFRSSANGIKNSNRKRVGWRLKVLGFAGAMAALVIAVVILKSRSQTRLAVLLNPQSAQVDSLSTYSRNNQAPTPLMARRKQTTNAMATNGALYGSTSTPPAASLPMASAVGPPPPPVSISKGKSGASVAYEYAGAGSQVTAPMIARTVSMTILVKDFAASRGELEQVLTRHRGYSAQLTVNTQENAARSFEASLRVPAGELAASLSELKALGHVQTETQSGEEVSQQHTDLVARLKNARETEERFQAILRERAGKIEDVLQVEQEIERVRGEIETMEAEQKALEHRVDFATVDLQLTEEYQEHLNASPTSLSTQMHNALVAGYRNASGTVVGIVLFFAEYGPTLLIFAVIFGVPFVLLRRRYKRAQARLE